MVLNDEESLILDRIMSDYADAANDPDFLRLLNKASELMAGRSEKLNYFLQVINYYQKLEVKLTLGEIGKGIIPALTSYLIGAIATDSYLEIARGAAGDNKFSQYANPIGALILNFILNGYFFHLVISKPWNNLVYRKPQEVQLAINCLMELPSNTRAKLSRFAYTTGEAIVYLIPAIASAIPPAIIDKKGGRPLVMVLLVLASTTALGYQGVKEVCKKLLPLITWPFNAWYRYKHLEARDKHTIETSIALLKEAHLEALEAAHHRFLELVQTKQEYELEKIYELLMVENPSKLTTLKLLLTILNLGNTNENPIIAIDSHHIERLKAIARKISNGKIELSSKQAQDILNLPIGKWSFQVGSTVATIMSVPGFAMLTIEYLAENLNLNDFLKWTFGPTAFFISVLLVLYIGWVVGEDCHRIASHATKGIIQAAQKSAGSLDFISKALKNTILVRIENWHSVLKLPLAVIQNPKIMLSSTLTLYILSYWSTQSTTELNKEYLDTTTYYIFFVPAIISVMLFNIFPVDKVLGSVQQLFMRWFGSDKSLAEIKLNQFLNAVKELVCDSTNTSFLAWLEDITNNDSRLNLQEREAYLKLSLANKTSADIYGDDHEFAKSRLTEVVDGLATENLKRIKEAENLRFFSKKGHQRGYGAISKTADYPQMNDDYYKKETSGRMCTVS